MSSKDIEYRYPIGGGDEGLMVFDGRVVEYFNLASGGSIRIPFPEAVVERSEPNKKGAVEFKFRLPGGSYHEFPVQADAVAGFDDFLAKLQKAGA